MGPHSLRFTLLSCILAVASCLQAQTQGKVTSEPVHLDNQNPLVGFKHFSADVTGGIAHDHDRKIYRSGDLMRLDFEDSYRVSDLVTLHMWGVTGNKCVEFSRPDAGTFPFSAYHDFKVERSATQEEEMIDGHACKIENVTFTPADGRPLVVKMKLWEAKDLEGFPVRIDVEAGNQKFSSTYTNVSLGAPDPGLFKHPVKCTPGAQPGQSGTAKIAPAPEKK